MDLHSGERTSGTIHRRVNIRTEKAKVVMCCFVKLIGHTHLANLLANLTGNI